MTAFPVAYLFLELSILLLVCLLASPRRVLESLDRRTLVKLGLLYTFWLALDLLAVHLDLWKFPAGGSLSPRILGLPVEEHLLFVLHSLVCLGLDIVLFGRVPGREEVAQA